MFRLSIERIMAKNAPERRLLQLRGVLSPKIEIRMCSNKDNGKNGGDSINIGGVSVPINIPSSPELVPKLYIKSRLSQSTLQHLKWMISKDLIGQDMYLLGPPGPLCRHLSLAFAELVGREVEYVTLSRDTTEVDLKQRREIINNTVHYMDQAVVRAAVEGRVLILEGLEKAERNVLPILNNLLENREAQLDDGRFIMSHERYDKLASEYSQEQLDSWQLVRASEKFRVIALGLPVPPYHGNTLDPPLRSRFQARHILPPPFPEALQDFQYTYPNIPQDKLTTLLSVAYTIHSLTGGYSGGPINLSGQLNNLVDILTQNPAADLSDLIHSVFPAELLGMKQTLDNILEKFGISSQGSSSFLTDNQLTCVPNSKDLLQVSYHQANSSQNISFSVPGYQTEINDDINSRGYVSLPHHQLLLSHMLQSHLVGDICLIGPKGSGKSTLVNQLANVLGYNTESVVLYQDMTSRDLLQQRTTHSNEDTGWRLTPLITAALNGHMAVLDGIHRLDPSTITTLKRLIQDRELNLTDGTRLLREDRYNASMKTAKLTNKEMTERSIYPIHSKFRIVAIGERIAQQINNTKGDWLNPEVLSMFQYIHVTPLPQHEERQLLLQKVPKLPSDILDKLLDFTQSLRISDDPIMQSLSSSLSTRQLLRIVTRLSHYPEDTLYDAIMRACLSRFLPSIAKATLSRALSSHHIYPSSHINTVPSNDTTYSRASGVLHIGATKVPLHSDHNDVAMVPDVIFYDNPLHLHLLEELLKDYSLGEHLLLIGNQGVGKNKLADRLLHLLHAPREYLQLHRDSTVQTLTTQPSVVDGRITYQDSPLVRAVQFGRILVVDEADKAPTHVTAILRNIVGGEPITLADGRKISPSGQQSVEGNIIPVHPDFRMIVLANRPGFPFLGNDFYAALGDCFSCHAIDNPDLPSEMSMVRQYGPNVPEDILKRLVSAFAELRQMADEGKISYPYSTREVVNIVRHLQEFPEEGVSNVVRNVFDFDSYSPHLLDTVLKTLHKHGIPAGATKSNVRLTTKQSLSSLTLSGQLMVERKNSQQLKHSQLPVMMKGPFKVSPQLLPCDRDIIRSRLFSEIKCQWTVPLHESNYVSSICQGPSAIGHHSVLHMATGNLPCLYSLNIDTDRLSYLDLFDYLPSGRGMTESHISLSVVDSDFYKGNILIHEGSTNLLYLLNPADSTLTQLILETTTDTGRLLGWRGRKREDIFVCTKLPNNTILIHQKGGNVLNSLNFSQRVIQSHSISIPYPIQTVLSLSSDDNWIIKDTNNRLYLLSKSSSNAVIPDILSPITGTLQDELISLSSNPVSENATSALLSHLNIEHQQNNVIHLASTMKSQAALLTTDSENYKLYTSSNEVKMSSDIAYLPNEGTIVYTSSNKTTPTSSEQYLSVFDLPTSTYWQLQIPQPDMTSLYTLPWTNTNLMIIPLNKDSVLTVNESGVVSAIEVGHYSLQKSLDEWYQMVGESSDGKQLTLSRDSGLDTSKPKHGKVDPSNAPHVGGNTWAGGTGGRDTAGLGGKGGPYRLDAGHNVFQLSDEEKMAVPEEVKQAARELGQKALKERLQEIAMSEPDHKMYTQLIGRVDKQMQMLRAILENTQSKDAERQWLRHQTSGDLDDRKLVDGLTGEKSVYKRRGEKEPEFGQHSQHPKCIRVLVDVSGSMYRFNGYDGRLDRTLESVLMVIEAFEAHRHKFKLDIVGHSGDEVAISFMSSEEPPTNEKQKMDILKAMHAHAQFCWSGDNTVKATKQAMTTISQEPADEHYVIVLSDANFSRYYINPKEYGQLLMSDSRVKAFAIFIGSLGDEATRLRESLPAGRSFVCMNNNDLPLILQQILSSSVL